MHERNNRRSIPTHDVLSGSICTSSSALPSNFRVPLLAYFSMPSNNLPQERQPLKRKASYQDTAICRHSWLLPSQHAPRCRQRRAVGLQRKRCTRDARFRTSGV